MAPATITLTPTTPEELPVLFQFQREAEGRRLAAFIPKDADDEAAYVQRHTGYLADPTITARTIWADGVRVGSIAKFMVGDEAEITYWLHRPYWGRGLAGAALRAFLAIEQTRPLYARVAFDNYGSQRVLEKGGFVKIGTDSGFANARQAVIEEYVYRLAS